VDAAAHRGEGRDGRGRLLEVIGVDAGIYVVPRPREDREYVQLPRALMTASGIDVAGSGYLRARLAQVASPANRWGQEQGRPCQSAVDEWTV
jgi:hypothetical protein